MKKIIFFILFVLVILAILWLLFWFAGRKKFFVEYGISFNQNHAMSLGLDWRETYVRTLFDLRPEHIRIAAMWNEIEPVERSYDFNDVDFMIEQAAVAGAKVTLVIGQKAPRWPECHIPAWVDAGDDAAMKDYLFSYIEAVVARYKNHPSLDVWQVENEPFIRFEFGDCRGYREAFVVDEIALVKSLDSNHGIVITDSGELSTWIKASKAGDIFGTTIYRIVQTKGGMIWAYDWLPAGYYRIKARILGKTYESFYVSELQAEPWFTDASPLDTSIEIQEKTMNPKRLKKHLDYASRVGASRVYLWGAEWWYFMKEVKGDNRYWEIIREIFQG